MVMESNRFSRIEALIEKITEREHYYEAFLDASPWGILVVDESYRIVYINTAMEEISGYTLAEIDGEHLHILIPPETRKKHQEHEKEYSTNPRIRYGDHPFTPEVLMKSGGTCPVEISLAPAVVKGETYYFASVRPRSTLQGPGPEDHHQP